MKKLIILSLILTATLNSIAQVKIRECAIVGGVLKEIDVDYDQGTGDRSVMVNGVKKDFYSVYPKTGAGYAATQSWFINNEPVQLESRSYVKYGLPRILGINEIVKTTAYKGVNVYVEAGITGIAEVIYIPVRQGCEFQPYQINCGDVDIKIDSIGATTIKLTAKASGMQTKLTYEWTLEDGKILKGQGTSSITVDIKDAMDFEATVKVSDARNCPVTGYKWIKGKKKMELGWNKAEREAFMESCMANTGSMDKTESKNYCSCMLEKIVKLYPDPIEAEKKLTEEVIMPMARECLKK